ncbi:MAG: delta-class carbonic anhydrase [Gammaproteobacteria bacterium]|nr:delta-class carbonic anhydrase [Gammaproteobacteria bacterium]
MKINRLTLFIYIALIAPTHVIANNNVSEIDQQTFDKDMGAQRLMLKKKTVGKGFGPQSPRDIDSHIGSNRIAFNSAPASSAMNLCNIHFHKNAEHKGGEFTKIATSNTGAYQSGYLYSGLLSMNELKPINTEVCSGEHGRLFSGDTIEVHYVYSTSQVKPGPTLAACLSDSIKNPQLRVESQVYVLVNDRKALDFNELTQYDKNNGFYQALNIPSHTGTAVEYAGSTTGPSYNDNGSPFQVTWNVRPKVAKTDISSVAQWCGGNVFAEKHAHGVRNLVINPDLLSKIAR